MAAAARARVREEHLSMRDATEMLGMSHQRVAVPRRLMGLRLVAAPAIDRDLIYDQNVTH